MIVAIDAYPSSSWLPVRGTSVNHFLVGRVASTRLHPESVEKSILEIPVLTLVYLHSAADRGPLVLFTAGNFVNKDNCFFPDDSL